MGEKFNIQRLLISLGFKQSDCESIFIHPKGYQVDLMFDDNEKRNNYDIVMCRDPFLNEKIKSFWDKVAIDFVIFFENDMDNYELPIPQNFHISGYRKFSDFDKKSLDGWMNLFNTLGWEF